jgi:carbamoyl-phosphate synthase large subunit
VQLRQRDGQPVPFEINPRFSGTTAVRARMGFNEVDAAIRHFVLGEDAPSLAGVKTGIALRYWNEVYVPSDAVAALRRDGRLEDVGALDVQVERWGCGP